MPQGHSPWADILDLISPQEVATVFDVGANVGQTTVDLVRAFPAAQVYGFEPVLSTFASLEANIRTLERARCFPYGFSDQPLTTEIFIQLDSTWNSVSKNLDRGAGTERIRLSTLDLFTAEHAIQRVNLIKTDTEGHDLRVLKGAEGLLSQGRVDAIYCEVGFYREDRGHTYFCEVLEYLEERAFQLASFYELDGIKFIDDPIEPWYPWTNALFVRNELVQRRYYDERARYRESIRREHQRRNIQT